MRYIEPMAKLIEHFRALPCNWFKDSCTLSISYFRHGACPSKSLGAGYY